MQKHQRVLEENQILSVYILIRRTGQTFPEVCLVDLLENRGLTCFKKNNIIKIYSSSQQGKSIIALVIGQY